MLLANGLGLSKSEEPCNFETEVLQNPKTKTDGCRAVLMSIEFHNGAHESPPLPVQTLLMPLPPRDPHEVVSMVQVGTAL